MPNSMCSTNWRWFSLILSLIQKENVHVDVVIHFHFMGGTILYSESSFFFVIMQMHQFSRSVMSDSLWPHGLQHPRLPCLSPTPRADSYSCPSSWWCHPTISPSVIPISCCLQSFPVSGSFPVSQFFSLGGNFSISPSNEYSGLISFRIDWLDLLAVQETLKGLLQHHSSKASSLWHSVFR